MCLIHGFETTFKLNDNVGGFVHRDEDYNFDDGHHQMTTMMSLSCSAIENSPSSSNSSGSRNGKVDGTSLNNPSSNSTILFSTSPTSVMDVMSCLPSTTADETATAAATITVNSITHRKFSISPKPQQKRHRRSKYRLARCSSHMKSCPFLLAVCSEGEDEQPMDVRSRNNNSIRRKPQPKPKIHRRCHAILDFSDVLYIADLQSQSQQSKSQEQPTPDRRCFCYTAKSA